MPTIWGRRTSSNVQIAMWAAAEVGLDVERIDLGGAFGGNDDPEFRAMNPNGFIPVLKDNDLVVFESAAILRYLGAQYGADEFWPKDPKKRAKLDKWAEWTKTTLCPVLIYQVFWTLVRTPSKDRNLEQLASQIQNLGELMTLASNHLGGNKFLCGDNFTFADVMFGHTLYRYYTLEIDRPRLKNLASYYDRLQTRNAYREHVMIDYSALMVE